MTHLSSIASLLFVLALLVAALWVSRKKGLGAPVGPLRVRGHVALEGRRSVYLLEVGTRVLVVGSSEAGLSTLAELNAAELDDGHQLPSDR